MYQSDLWCNYYYNFVVLKYFIIPFYECCGLFLSENQGFVKKNIMLYVGSVDFPKFGKNQFFPSGN